MSELKMANKLIMFRFLARVSPLFTHKNRVKNTIYGASKHPSTIIPIRNTGSAPLGPHPNMLTGLVKKEYGAVIPYKFAAIKKVANPNIPPIMAQ